MTLAERPARPLHAALLLLVLWLLATSPWITLYRHLPLGGVAGALNGAHVLAGLAAAGVTAVYTHRLWRAGGWRLHFPWLAGRATVLGREFARLLRGRLPSSEGGALFPTIEGLLLLALATVAASGVLWLALMGSDAAMLCADVHALAVRAFVMLLALHVLAVATHLLDFVR